MNEFNESNESNESNEMRLLKALCEALGYKIVTTLDYQRKMEDENSALRFKGNSEFMGRRLVTENIGNRFYIDENGMYESELVNPIVTYELIEND